MVQARSGQSLTQTPAEPSSSVPTFAMLEAGAQALNMPMALICTERVAPTQVATATSGKTRALTWQKIGTAASNVRLKMTTVTATSSLSEAMTERQEDSWTLLKWSALTPL